jgi:pleiotropic regulator 1
MKRSKSFFTKTIQHGTNKQETDDLESRIQCSLDNSLELFKYCPTQRYLLEDYESTKIAVATKLKQDYPNAYLLTEDYSDHNTKALQLVEKRKREEESTRGHASKRVSTALTVEGEQDYNTRALQLHEKRRRVEESMKPRWHPPWKLMRVISGNNGWVRAVAVDVSNEWFATGSTDRTIRLHDLASGKLKLTLTGHISSVRGLAISDRRPYLFSVGEDKTVKCWDLEQNKCIKHYHGHLSGVYCCALHPTLDLLITGGRDQSARVWDIRTRTQVHLLTGHTNTVASVIAQAGEPQVITGSMDSMIRLWDLRMGKSYATLTNHKKSVRSLVFHPSEYTFASASADSIKKWKCPEGRFMQNFEGHNAIVNTLSINTDNVLFSGGDNGSLCFWDWKTGYKFQELQTTVQPGSLDSEAAIYCSTFDRSGARLLTGEGDKTVKVWKEDENATEETHPINWVPNLTQKKY